MRDNNFTIRSLYRWAQEDNPLEYKKYVNESLRKKQEDRISQ